MRKYEPNELTSQSSLCPNCRFPVSAEDTFCGECGFDLTQESAESFSQAPADEGPGGAETGALQARVGHFTAPRSLRRSYFDLGLALKAQARYREAVEAFAQALQAAGSTPKDVDILLQQAYVYEQGTNPERAFRTYLEAVSKNPDEADIVLPHIHHMVTSKIVLENGVWLVSEWAQSVEKIRVSPSDRVQIAAFLGRIHLFLGQYEEALAAFQRALQANVQSASAVVSQMLNPAYLPPEFEPQANRGQAQFALARIWQAVGNFDEALRVVELALSLDLGDGDYPEAPVQHLKADLLASRGQTSGAAQWYYEAGRRYYWRGEYDSASRLLELAASIKKNYPEAWWYWMDTERMLAYDAQPPFVNRRTLERSLLAWRSGLHSGWPGEEFFWAYTSRALLCELEARLNPSRRVKYWWDAIRWLELALALDPGDGNSWAYQGRFFGFLDLGSNREVVTARALELDQDNLSALEERSALLANRGQFEEAGQMMARRRELEASSWLEGEEADILVGQADTLSAQLLFAGQKLPDNLPWLSKYEEALRLLDPLVASEPDESWYHQLRLICLCALPGRKKEADAETKYLYEAHLDPDQAQNIEVRFISAWTAFYSGVHIEEAAGIFESMLDDQVLGRNSNSYLGMCLLKQGKLDQGENYLLQGVSRTKTPQDCVDIINDLQRVGSLPAELYTRLRNRIAARNIELQQFPSANDEIRTALQRMSGDPGQETRTAIAAVQARLALDAGEYELALRAYQQLAVTDFPAKEHAMNEVIDTWQEDIDALLRENRFIDAHQQLLKMESMAPSADQPDRLAELDARLALVAFSQEQTGEGQEYFTRAVNRGNEAQWVAAGEQIGETWRDLLVNPVQLWRVDGQLRGLEASPDITEEAAAARRSLLPFLDTYFQLDLEITAEDDPYCLPIVLWVGSDLLKLVDPEVDRAFIYQDIPALGQRIQDTMGIDIPTVFVYNDQGQSSSFEINFFELLVARGEVHLEMNFCSVSPADLDKLKVPKKKYIPAYDPFSGNSGCWVASKHTQTVINAGWKAASAGEYMLAHLESVLREHLADFVSVERVERLLDQLDARWNDLMDRSLPNMAARLGFARLLRALVREHVPVTRLPEILQAGANGGLDDPARFAEMLRAARLRLSDQLPGNQGESILPVPPEWEKRMQGWWTEHEGMPVIEPPASEIDALQSAVREWTSVFDRPGALLVQSPRLRPYLRRWIEADFPDWPVLSLEETGRAQAKA